VTPLLEVSDEAVARVSSGIPLLDRVLGGGVVPGGAVLLAGEPGIGKSTLLLEAADAMARQGLRVLYVSAEESPRQLRLRAERLSCGHPDLLVAGETGVESVAVAIEEHKPAVVIVDSIQAVRSDGIDSLPGSVGQVRTCAELLVQSTKQRECALFLVGHITKEGNIAGPKSLEHLVDTVLTFEGEGSAEFRLLRAAKNRFGPTGEVALFEMSDRGLTAVADPSRILLAQRHPGTPGSAVAASVHGSRPLLVEVQALVAPTAFPSPRRMTLGLDGNRVALLLAVLERYTELRFADRDVYLNVVGGIALKEPAVDLAVAAALMSAMTERSLPADVALFGEVGLLGEVRPVSRSDARLREISALGFQRAIGPPLDRVKIPKGLQWLAVEHVSQLAGRLRLRDSQQARD
jgi:DNA repair protein RadA/Sms